MLSIHVRDYYKWNRAKTIVGIGCLMGAIGAIGGLEDNGGINNPKLAGLLIVIGAMIAVTIDNDWERKT